MLVLHPVHASSGLHLIPWPHTEASAPQSPLACAHTLHAVIGHLRHVCQSPALSPQRWCSPPQAARLHVAAPRRCRPPVVLPKGWPASRTGGPALMGGSEMFPGPCCLRHSKVPASCCSSSHKQRRIAASLRSVYLSRVWNMVRSRLLACRAPSMMAKQTRRAWRGGRKCKNGRL